MKLFDSIYIKNFNIMQSQTFNLKLHPNYNYNSLLLHPYL